MTSEKLIAKRLATDVYNKANRNLRNVKKLYLHKDLCPDNLTDEMADANRETYDFVLNFHLNAFDGSGRAKGFETFKYKYETNNNILKLIENIRKYMTSIGFYDRGVKDSPGFDMIDEINPVALLWEFGFMDNFDDMNRFTKYYDGIVNQLAYAITYFLSGNVLLIYSDQTTGGTEFKVPH